MLDQACLDEGKICIRHFNNRGSFQELVRACLGTSKDCKPRFNHRGSLQ